MATFQVISNVAFEQYASGRAVIAGTPALDEALYTPITRSADLRTDWTICTDLADGVSRALPVREIQVEVAGQFTRARLLRGGGTAAIRRTGAYAGFTVPELKDYEVAVLE